MSINKVILVGNIGKDPETKQNSKGEPIVNMSIATSDAWKDKTTGEKQSKTEWHKVVLFGSAAKFASSYATKGLKVYLEGKLQTRKWTDNSGIDKWTTEIIIDNFVGTFQLLNSDNKESKSGAKEPEVNSGEDLDDDIPF